MTRHLPDFSIVGALRSGTTSLYHLLGRVPGICLTDFKECDYFVEELNYNKGPDWYADLYNDHNLVCGDISPNYASDGWFDGVPERLFKAAPNAKIFYIVREPVERTRSHYYQMWSHREDMVAPKDIFDTPLGEHMLACSQYMRQLNAYLKFFPKEQIHILRFEDLKSNPALIVKTVCDTLGVEISDEQLAELKLQHRNSSQDLADVSNWWRSFGQWLRRNDIAIIRKATDLVPQALISTVKGLVAKKPQSDRQLPEFTADIQNQVRDYLSEDNAQFEAFAKTL